MNNVGFDIDGVVADFNRAMADALGYNPVHIHPDRWDWPRSVAADATVERVWGHITTHAAWWYQNIPPYSEAATSTFKRDLHKIEDEMNLYFITSRPQVPGMKYYTELWLKERLKVRNPTVIVAADKGLVAAGIGLTHFVDDNADNCEAVAGAIGGRCHIYIPHRPYNSSFENKYVKRIHTLAEFTGAVLRPVGAKDSISLPPIASYGLR